MPRSGTNYLHQLLSLHPDCALAEHEAMKEDFLLHHASFLTDYADRLAWQWGHWGEATPVQQDLLQGLGHGLEQFLAPSHPARIVLTKTPSVRNTIDFFDLFPDARLLLIIRDGRSVVASGMKGFGWNFEKATRRWVQAARTVIDVQQRFGESSNQHLIFRYEDLNADPKAVLVRIFQFLELSAHTYDYSEALDLPLYGSSFSASTQRDVNWQPQPKPKAFNSQERWAEWPDGLHARFNWLGADELRQLGYVPKENLQYPLGFLRHRLTDVRHTLACLPKHLRRSLGAGVRAFQDAFQERL
jgi:hypothetical protein